VLGLPYDYQIDIWSVGVSLFEIATGRILFQGKSNNEMLYLMSEVLGPIPKKLRKKGEFSSMHYEENGTFKRVMEDQVTGKEFIKPMIITKPTVNIKDEIMGPSTTPEEQKLLMQFYDLLTKILIWDPKHRITPDEALKHSFLCS
jgi:serine/threonine-protein kinase PRP4